MTSKVYEDGVEALRKGRLLEARELLETALVGQPDEAGVRASLAMACYRANDFARAVEVGESLPGMQTFATQLRSFGKDTPYQRLGAKSTSVPFLITDPLPVVPIDVDGIEICALIDTGGGQLILDTELAGERGIASVGEIEGSFGGGLKAPVGHGRVESVRLGECELRRVPVQLLATRRFSPITGGRHTIDGIIGTNVLAQFRPTLDYPAQQLLLEPPDAGQPLEGVEIPFELYGDHYMVAEGAFNGLEGLRFFVDSGLAGGAFMCAKELLERAGVPVPEARLQPGSVGGGGGQFATGSFPVDELGLGPLRQRDLVGVYAPTEGGSGASWDGLISHGFLRHYRWTLDFERSVYVMAEGD